MTAPRIEWLLPCIPEKEITHRRWNYIRDTVCAEKRQAAGAERERLPPERSGTYHTGRQQVVDRLDGYAPRSRTNQCSQGTVLQAEQNSLLWTRPPDSRRISAETTGVKS